MAFNGLHDGDAMADSSQPVFVRSSNEEYKRTNTHTHTHTPQAHTYGNPPTSAIGENEMRCILLKIRL